MVCLEEEEEEEEEEERKRRRKQGKSESEEKGFLLRWIFRERERGKEDKVGQPADFPPLPAVVTESRTTLPHGLRTLATWPVKTSCHVGSSSSTRPHRSSRPASPEW
ncbi:hypothetical protein MRB53_035921 [Persea americana]|uniref:Uncharacterized protein n=1 Tax=Persea americana TaxID=3435 RepID=A0ACC2K607_PERAE|nr:hypothetical protein MRB53_035921 [Persea americana]